MLIDQPVAGNIRFGKLLEVLDKLAEDVALSYVRRHLPDAGVVTAAVDQIQVRGPADINRDLRLRARINFVGRSSLEVGIRCEHPPGGRDTVYPYRIVLFHDGRAIGRRDSKSPGAAL